MASSIRSTASSACTMPFFDTTIVLWNAVKRLDILFISSHGILKIFILKRLDLIKLIPHNVSSRIFLSETGILKAIWVYDNEDDKDN